MASLGTNLDGGGGDDDGGVGSGGGGGGSSSNRADGCPSPHPQHCWVKLSTCPPESRTNEYKSLYTCSDRCPAIALSQMRKYLSEFISACLNMDMNGSITFGVMESGEYDILAVREGLDRAKLGDLPAITCGFA